MKRVNRRYDDALSRQSWRDFERLLADHYRREGFQVEHCGTGAAGSRYDGGIDLKLRRGDEYIIVECKHWNVMQVPHNVVHQLMGIMANEGATGAILVTSGEFTPYAKEAANKLGYVQLVDGVRLREMLGLPEPLSRAEELAMALPSLSHRSNNRSKRNDDASKKAWIMFSVAAAIALFFLLKALLSATAWTAGPSSQHADSAAVTSAPSRAALPRRHSTAHAELEAVSPGLIDWQTGTTISQQAYPPPRRPTAAEIRESQRQADEAMKVIEATTPEMR